MTAIPVCGGLHLKSFMSMAGPDLIAVGTSEPAMTATKLIKSKAKFEYSFLELPDDIAANCLYANGHLVRVSEEHFPQSAGILALLKVEGKQIELDASELNKVDGCLTCCSVLIKK